MIMENEQTTKKDNRGVFKKYCWPDDKDGCVVGSMKLVAGTLVPFAIWSGIFFGAILPALNYLEGTRHRPDHSIPYKARKPVVQNAIVQTHDAESIDKFINRNSLGNHNDEYRLAFHKVFGYAARRNEPQNILNFEEKVDTFTRMGIGNYYTTTDNQVVFPEPTLQQLEKAIQSYEEERK